MKCQRFYNHFQLGSLPWTLCPDRTVSFQLGKVVRGMLREEWRIWGGGALAKDGFSGGDSEQESYRMGECRDLA